MAKPDPSAEPKLINLALQGGGAHGAFSWGVLDRLLEDPRVEIEAITGASAGAMNAVALAAGYHAGDREEAREALRLFWNGVLDEARTSPLRRSPIEAMLGSWNLDASPAYVMFDLVTRLASPYDLNPYNLNPLKDLVVSLVDFDRVRKSKVKVFISATNVETGRAHVWDKKDLTADHVMASACLPWLFQAVEIDGVPYWDGGFTGNPALWPLFEHCKSDDVVLVQINPIKRPGAPTTARDIINRVNEITFNAALLHDLRAIDFVTRLIEAGRLEGTGYRRMLVHAIADEKALSALGASSKFNVEPDFIDMLFGKGREAAENWLHTSFHHVGVRSTVNVRKLFHGDDDSLDGDQLKPPRRKPKAAE
ncbi:MAG TPA: patatin-like phospholipase family protein [Hyphomonadaceae bacterium]|jgi:NTE family protein|nr:patatin-like phospholipase family protein [Hyphomonadaceae bacterium]